MTPSSPIGIFDSGVGGLTVFSELVKKLGNEDAIYLADTARVPYGGRPPQEIIKINQEIYDFFIDYGAKLIVLACGTSSAIAYPVLKDKYKIELISMIEPGARMAASATKNKKIGVIATAGTVNSLAYPKALQAIDKAIEVHSHACPLFVPLIEGGFSDTDETKRTAKEYLKPLIKEGVDTLILGCTHYPHLSHILQEILGPMVALINPAEETVSDVKKMLKKAGTLQPKTHLAKYEYLVTGSPIQFQDIGSRLLGKSIIGAKQVKL